MDLINAVELDQFTLNLLQVFYNLLQDLFKIQIFSNNVFLDSVDLVLYSTLIPTPDLSSDAFLSWPTVEETLPNVRLENVIVVPENDITLTMRLGGLLELKSTRLGNRPKVIVEAGSLSIDVDSAISVNANGPKFTK